MEGINNMGEQVGNVSREMKAKINQKEILAIKHCKRKEECF